LTLKITTQSELFRRASIYRGIYTRVAKELDVTPSVVRRVALGITKSARISKALASELRRVEKKAARAA